MFLVFKCLREKYLKKRIYYCKISQLINYQYQEQYNA